MIPFLDVRSQYRLLKTEIDAAVHRVLDSGQYTLGEEVAAFEEAFADYCQVPYGIAVNSGTSALHLALLTAGVGPGDEVITVPFTFVATVAAILYTGARPVFVDIDPHTFTIDVDGVPGRITPRTKVLLPVHLYGHPANMEPLLDLARYRGLTVIEDAAQAHGATYRARPVGALGDLGCFSFYPGKNLGSCGEGGFVTTSNAELARKVRLLRDWGAAERYRHELAGFNYRMEALQAAILRVKLSQLDSWNSARERHAALYDRELADSPLTLPSVGIDCRHAYHLYAIRATERDKLQRWLQKRGICSGIHYPCPVHLQPAYSHLGYRRGAFPVAERAAEEELSLPIDPLRSAAEIEQICEAIGEFHRTACRFV